MGEQATSKRTMWLPLFVTLIQRELNESIQRDEEILIQERISRKQIEERG
jgi:hypothetical protein